MYRVVLLPLGEWGSWQAVGLVLPRGICFPWSVVDGVSKCVSECAFECVCANVYVCFCVSICV